MLYVQAWDNAGQCPQGWGSHVILKWNEFEPTQGNYNFSAINSALSAADRPCYLQIGFSMYDKSLTKPVDYTPSYCKSSLNLDYYGKVGQIPDYHDGGARYNSSYIQGVGVGSLTDMLSAVKQHVYEERDLGMNDLLAALRENFSDERTRLLLANRTPRFGNDDERADALTVRIFAAYFNAVDGRRNTRGGEYHINLLPTTVHVYFGSVTGATPDGRRAGQPLSEGVSPVQGADRCGPTAVLRSVAKMDHARTGGTLLNQKFTPQLLADQAGLNGLVQLIRAYFAMRGHHIQFNVVDAETLRAAQRDPQSYRDLIVRVAGYSDYFCDLSETLQDEIIARTEQVSF